MMTQNSQDAFNSQQLSSGSEVQSSQGRRRFLDNYMSVNGNHQSRGHGNIHQKSSKSDHPSSAVSTKSNFLQQLQFNKAKARERDERDLLNVVVKTVKDCSEDVKCTMNNMQDILSRSTNTTDDKLSVIMSSISQNIQKNYEKMIAAVQKRDQKSHQQNILEHEIKQKVDRIQELEQQVKDAHEMGFRNVVQSMKEVVDQHQAVTKEKLERLSDITSELLDHQKEMIHQQREGQDQQHQLHLEVQDAVRAQTGTDDKRVLDELLILRQELDQHKYELENSCREKVYSTQRQTEDLKKFMRVGFEDNVQESIEQSKQLYENHCQQLKENINTHQDNIKSFIDQKFKEKSAESSEKNSSLNTEHEEPLWIGKNRQRFSDYHESVPKKIQDQLNEMHNNHIKEIERIRKEINQRNEESQSKRDCQLPPGRSGMLHSKLLEFQEMENDNQDKGLNFIAFEHGKKSSFISPGNIRSSGWTAKQLFSKTNPSPVATVYPQRKEQEISNKLYANDKQSQSSDEQKQAPKSKPRGSAQPQRRSQRLLETKETAMEEKGQDSHNNYTEQRNSQRISSMQSACQEDGRQEGSGSYDSNMSYQQRRQNNPLGMPQLESRHTSHQEQKRTSHTEKMQNGRQEPRQVMTLDNRQTFTQEPQQESKKHIIGQWNTEENYSKSTGNLRNTDKCTYSRTPRQSGFKAPEGILRVNTVKSNVQCYSHPAVSHKTASVYDFSDEVSAVRCHQKPSIANPRSGSCNFINSRELHGQRNEYSQDMSSSRESSPSLSVTKIVIQRKVKRDRNPSYQTLEAAAKKLDNSQGQYKEYDDDLLSILGSFKDQDNYNKQPKQSHCQRGNKRPIADYSFGTTYAQVTESIHKKRKHIL
ncbi:putative leucine-rich repeat-containing protein DDB_G0290503 [Mizuhopecten yessoensis]|nr:putative leucine-rich repeat-containing protein DDB_G0290503 [Mizuhopecten yessoensis]